MTHWEHLLSKDKARNSSTVQKSVHDGRNPFEEDYSRLVFSAPVRRLQDKAQVFPLDKSDYVRTRLTHSLEVSSIARSIGSSIENKLIKEKPELNEIIRGKLSSILATIGLVHDIGNPPFGHFGESVIQTFFKEWFKEEKNQQFVNTLTPEQKADFENFEGNTQTFRLLTKLNYLIDDKGYNLTFATLASIVKYPRSSIEGNRPKDKRISYHKFGYFQSEKATFEAVKEKTQIRSSRHPLAFLLEASDDIAYSAADIEDGLKKNVISYEMIKDVLGSELNFNKPAQKELYETLEQYKNEVHSGYQGNIYEVVLQRFRIKAQGYMIESVVDLFCKKEKQILNGEFDEDIILASEAKEVRVAFKKLAGKHIFSHQSIVTKELVGEKIICGLLDLFVNAVMSTDRNKPKTKNGKLYSLISPNYRFICETYPYDKTSNGEPSVYDRLLLVTDFICGMTDSYALDLYQRLTGIKL
ncbi:deoxyguanosinetriphosphate triphosphohydrolase [Priestia megaterium]|uniref:deoxyguanosinetriphosphate triphosphohydrolase n=1 Tax=Priestia megaterium TaxID=1404 RepID=UPI00064CC915|nr:deoxyguanosinetriphosphate triphosphohydrolase [Priestia megaterium]KLV28946.1 deoxyguanosinetriphosphate triphosphohydrolase [Priestia megaterium]MCE4092557.1 deoxyguanosinetriphosphate triphosphohydrolase [Priestia megaterium]